MLDDGLRLALFFSPYRQCWELLLQQEKRDGTMFIAKPPEMESVNPAECILEPTAQLCDAAIQDLMDELWRQGVRPRNGAGAAGHLLALENHLDDMRALCVKFTGAKLPERKG